MYETNFITIYEMGKKINIKGNLTKWVTALYKSKKIEMRKFYNANTLYELYKSSPEFIPPKKNKIHNLLLEPLLDY